MTQANDAKRKRKVHIGCGPESIKEGWWNVDICPFPGIDQVMDASKPWKGLAEIEHIYAEHFLEHLRFDEALQFLKHAQEALRDGGKLRLTTPSLEWVWATHFDPNDAEPRSKILHTYAANRAFHGWGHKFLWSKPLIRQALKTHGFTQIRFVEYGKSADPILADVEEHGKYKIEKGFPSVWIVEAVKGERDREKMNAFRLDARKQFLGYLDDSAEQSKKKPGFLARLRRLVRRT